MNNPQQKPITASPVIYDPETYFQQREPDRAVFLSAHGWQGSEIKLLNEDCAFRRYYRIKKDNKVSILMDSVPDTAGIATPGHKLSDYIRVGKYLSSLGFAVPRILEENEADGFLLVEDMGDTTFRQALDSKLVDGQTLYDLATDVLIGFYERTNVNDIELPLYTESHIHKGRRRVIDWYLPALRKQRNPNGLVEEYLKVWETIEQNLPPIKYTFQHIDFHLQNLMFRSDANGIAQCGILDFQGAMRGPLPYDLVNLLDDARIVVPHDIDKACHARFVAALKPEDQEGFEAWYTVLKTQFHARVIGQFIRLAIVAKKPAYLRYIPRLHKAMRRNLDHEALHPLRDFLKDAGLDFSGSVADVTKLDETAELISPEAF
ncbi:MAG: phosphotransferase [Alphaproteobacteria bacterium]|nr:phosphotransferase [Alphaproteobacteria bacterium]